MDVVPCTCTYECLTTPQWLLALNQFLNALFGGNSYTTLSTRAYMTRRDGGWKWPANILDTLMFWHKKYGGHCKYAYWTDMCRWYNLRVSEGKELGKVNVPQTDEWV